MEVTTHVLDKRKQSCDYSDKVSGQSIALHALQQSADADATAEAFLPAAQDSAAQGLAAAES